MNRATVSVLAYEGMSVFETGIVTEVFGLPRPEFDVGWYELTVCAETPGAVRLVGGATLHTDHGLDVFAAADTLIVPGVADVHADPSPRLTGALRAAHRRGARIVSICSGAFALAGAGLLDGRRATTHWRYADLLVRRHPAVRVDPDVLYVDDGDVLTGAGSAAGLDLCVHLVRRDHGPTIANAVARRLVVPPHRDGGQAQYIDAPMPACAEADPLAETLAWAQAHLDEPLSVESLAERAAMSPRNFARRFGAATGTTPHQWLVTQRVALAQVLLETTDLGVDVIAERAGFGTAASFRMHLQRHARTTPQAYRRTFRGAASTV